jgi:hypothetical protein
MRSNHLLVVVAALAGALVVVVWLLSGFDARAADPTARERDAGVRAATQLDAHAAQLAPPPSSNDELERAAAAVADASQASVDEQTPRGLEIAPVRGARRERVGEAEVWYWPLSLAEARSGTSSFARAERTGTIDEGLEEFAQLLEREADGRWYAPPAAEGRLVARASGLWGMTEISRSSETPLFIVLEPEVEVRARVLDATGAAASGVRVALRQFWSDESYFDHGATLSGADGVARLRHLRHLVGGDWDFDARYAVAIDEPLLASVHVEIDVVRPPTETLELRLPAVGSVQVELESAPPESWVALEVFDLDEVPDEVERERDFETWLPLEDGKVTFPCVEVGRQLLVWLRSRDVEAPVDDVLRRGPRAHGESVVLRLQAKPQGATFAGRAVDDQGAPLAEMDFTADLYVVQQNRREHVERASGRTEADGRFVFSTAEDSTAATQLELNLRDERNVALGGARVSFAPPAAGATVELGDVRLVATSVLAAGRVLDVAGQPVPRAWVDLHEAVHRTRRDGSVRTSWERRSSPVLADDKGHFVVRGERKAASIGLRARSNGASSPLREFAAGSTEVELRLEHSGAIAGRLQLPPSLSTDFVWVKAVRKSPAVGDLLPQRDQWARPDTAGEFVLRGLALGAYDVRVVTSGGEREIGVVENVQVAASGETRDPRLDPLDLSGLEFRTVTILAPDGKLLSDAMAFTSQDGQEDAESRWISQGKLLVRLNDPTLWIVAHRCMIERFEPASGVDVVKLRPAANVRLQLQGPLAPPPDSHELHAWISGRGEPSFLVDQAADWLGVDGAQIQGAVRRPGAVTLRLQLHKGEELVAECELSDVGPIVDTDRQQTFELSNAPAEFLEALTKAREEQR